MEDSGLADIDAFAEPADESYAHLIAERKNQKAAELRANWSPRIESRGRLASGILPSDIPGPRFEPLHWKSAAEEQYYGREYKMAIAFAQRALSCPNYLSPGEKNELNEIISLAQKQLES